MDRVKLADFAHWRESVSQFEIVVVVIHAVVDNLRGHGRRRKLWLRSRRPRILSEVVEILAVN